MPADQPHVGRGALAGPGPYRPGAWARGWGPGVRIGSALRLHGGRCAVQYDSTGDLVVIEIFRSRMPPHMQSLTVHGT